MSDSPKRRRDPAPAAELIDGGRPVPTEQRTDPCYFVWNRPRRARFRIVSPSGELWAIHEGVGLTLDLVIDREVLTHPPHAIRHAEDQHDDVIFDDRGFAVAVLHYRTGVAARATELDPPPSLPADDE